MRAILYSRKEILCTQLVPQIRSYVDRGRATENGADQGPQSGRRESRWCLFCSHLIFGCVCVCWFFCYCRLFCNIRCFHWVFGVLSAKLNMCVYNKKSARALERPRGRESEPSTHTHTKWNVKANTVLQNIHLIFEVHIKQFLIPPNSPGSRRSAWMWAHNELCPPFVMSYLCHFHFCSFNRTLVCFAVDRAHSWQTDTYTQERARARETKARKKSATNQLYFMLLMHTQTHNRSNLRDSLLARNICMPWPVCVCAAEPKLLLNWSIFDSVWCVLRCRGLLHTVHTALVACHSPHKYEFVSQCMKFLCSLFFRRARARARLCVCMSCTLCWFTTTIYSLKISLICGQLWRERNDTRTKTHWFICNPYKGRIHRVDPGLGPCAPQLLNARSI